MGEPFGLVTRLGINNACCGLETLFEEVHHLVETPLEGCRDMFVHEGSPKLVCDDDIPPILLSNSLFLPCFHTLHFP